MIEKLKILNIKLIKPTTVTHSTMVDIDFLESLNIPKTHEARVEFDHQPQYQESLTNTMYVSAGTQLICPQPQKLMGIIVNKQTIDIKRILFKIYFTLFYANPELNFDLTFQLFIVHFGWIKTMATHVSIISSNELVLAIHKEFFNQMSYTNFLAMVRCINFHTCASSDYYKAFSTLVERKNYIDWKGLETDGFAHYELQNDAILSEFEHMDKLVKSFNQYMQNSI